jgi:sucrose phosphorylase
VQTIRSVFDIAAPKVAVITETNVPHKENIAYFGDGTNEAQMVYNFALPLLTLNAFHNEDVTTLSEWATTLDLPSDQATFFNFLACHDGIGMLPVKNILSLEDLNKVVDRTHKLGGFVSYKSNEDGSQSPYELNINYLDALSDLENQGNAIEFVAQRFLATQSIMLALRGVPGIYFHSLFGSRNWKEGVEETGRYRTINREKLQREHLERELENPASLRYHVFNGFRHMLQARKANPAFHPWGGQQIFSFEKSVFAILRTSLDGHTSTLCLTNVTHQEVKLTIDGKQFSSFDGTSVKDTLSNEAYAITDGHLKLSLEPYQILWLKVL